MPVMELLTPLQGDFRRWRRPASALQFSQPLNILTCKMGIRILMARMLKRNKTAKEPGTQAAAS